MERERVKADEFCTPRPKPEPRKPKARKRLPARSKKNAAAQVVLDAAREACFARDRCCVRCGTTSGLQAHHVKRRSQGGTHEVSNLIAVCPECHSWIHGHVAESKANGWLA